MIKFKKSEEKTRRITVFFGRPLYAFLISVVIGLFPSISFSQENLSEQNNMSSSEDNLKNSTQKIPKDKVERINHYDNAVLYNDHVVHELIDILKKSKINNSSLVYFSDHGEEVYDVHDHQFQGRNEAHPTIGMYAVPFFFWVGQNEYLNSKFVCFSPRRHQGFKR